MGEGDDDAALYNPRDDPSPKSADSDRPSLLNTKDDDGDASKPMLTRKSEDGPVFSIGDDEFGNWADDDDDVDDDTYFTEIGRALTFRVDRKKTPKGKHD